MEDQASGAMHVDPGARNCKYTRTEVKTLIAMTAALLRVMTLPSQPLSASSTAPGR